MDGTGENQRTYGHVYRILVYTDCIVLNKILVTVNAEDTRHIFFGSVVSLCSDNTKKTDTHSCSTLTCWFLASLGHSALHRPEFCLWLWPGGHRAQNYSVDADGTRHIFGLIVGLWHTSAQQRWVLVDLRSVVASARIVYERHWPEKQRGPVYRAHTDILP